MSLLIEIVNFVYTFLKINLLLNTKISNKIQSKEFLFEILVGAPEK